MQFATSFAEYLSDKVFKKGKVGVIRKYFKDEASRPRFNNTFFHFFSPHNSS